MGAKNPDLEAMKDPTGKFTLHNNRYNITWMLVTPDFHAL